MRIFKAFILLGAGAAAVGGLYQLIQSSSETGSVPSFVSDESLAASRVVGHAEIEPAIDVPLEDAAESVVVDAADRPEADSFYSRNEDRMFEPVAALPEAAALPVGEFNHPATMQMEPPLQAIGAAWLNDQGGNFTMPLPNGDELEIQVERFVAIGETGGEFVGTVKGYPESSVKLSYRGNGEAGTIRLPSENRMYVMLPGEDGSVIFQERENADRASFATPPIPLDAISVAPSFIPPPPPKIFEGESSTF